MSDLARAWPAGLDEGLRRRLEDAWGDPRRGYHDLQHLAEVLDHVRELLGLEDPLLETVRLAAWFHDAVYDGRPDDEERSARLAEVELTAAGVAPAVVAEVARLVRLTATHRPAVDDRAGGVLCDADLAVLAAGPERYAAYVRGVRREYAHVGDEAFARGRAAVLTDLLATPTLFRTDAARERWEAAARANVEAEVRSLTSR